MVKLRFSSVLFAILLSGSLTSGCISTSLDKSERDFVAQGNQYAKDGLLREAADSYRKALSQQPENLTANRNLGMVLVKTGDYKGAINNLEKALAKFENDYDTNYFLAEAYRAEDSWAKAIFHYQSALKTRNDDPKASKALAWSFYKIRYYSEALNIAKKLNQQRPDDEQAAIILARVLIRLKRPNEAISTIRAISQKAGKQSLPHFRSVEGDIHWESGNKARAAESYRLALKDQPLLASALLGLAKTLIAEGKDARAVPMLERAVRVRPQLTEAHLLLGKTLEKSNPKKSMQHYQTFIKQAANDPEFIDQLSDARQRAAALRITGKNER
jgi:tetratricopeptide (TPR) repeat protein